MSETSKKPQTDSNFSEKMTDILNYGALNLAMSIGYQLRLFDVMDEMSRPATAAAIASAAGLDTRYVTEWLAVMVCGGIIDLHADDSGQDIYDLPKSHADMITRRAGNANLGVYTQEIPLLTTCAMKSVVKGFTSGDGVGYEHYPKFQQFMTELADAKHQQVLVDIFLPSVDDGRLIQRLQSGIHVCDLGCAEGIALILMAQAYPGSAFTGIDVSGDVIAKATRTAAEMGIRNIRFLQRDAASLEDIREFEGSFDYITAFDAIHDQTRPMDALKNVRFMLKPNGLFSMVDIAASSYLSENRLHPMGVFLYTVSLMHCMPVGLVDGGAGLGMMWGRDRAVDMLKSAGFDHIDVTEIPNDSFNLHFLCKIC
jgi:2-polyprenyl-3-methyl-5-hydroxy-6-metoxy-1,4-benzoquinol methylase